jgi:hypothetical protein
MHSLLAIGDRNEMAWHIIDFGLMHDPDYSEVVVMAAAGPGYHSQRLNAMMMSPDEPVAQPSSSKSVPPPMAAERYRPRPMSAQEQKRANPFYRGVS